MIYRLFLIAMLAASAASAQQSVAAYYAEIGYEDFFNSRGQPIRDVGGVVQQDRANYHRFGIRHGADESDPYFHQRSWRAGIPDLVRAGGVDSYLRDLLGRGWPGFSQVWLIQICASQGQITHLRIDPADGDGYSSC